MAQEDFHDAGKKSPEKIEFIYIVNWNEKKNEFTSLHGETEVAENRRQLVIQKYFRDNFWDYLQCNNQTNDVSSCLERAGIPEDSLSNLVSRFGDILLKENAALCDSLGITARHQS